MPEKHQSAHETITVMIIAGEASGDQHGAKVLQSFREQVPGAVFFGIGGDALRSIGVEVVIDAADLAVVGITEVISKLPGLLKGFSIVKRLLRDRRPDLLILIDFPDFNLLVAAEAKKCHIPVLYYISPQLWAWRSGRIKKIRERVDHMAVILPFESEIYTRNHVPVTFVGHPLLDQTPKQMKFAYSAPPENAPLVGLLPGSRDREVGRLLPDMLAAIPLLRKIIPGVRFVISRSPSVKRSYLDSILSAHAPNEAIEIEEKGVQSVLARSTLVVAASGTVTLEAAIVGTPMVVIYRVSAVSYLLGRALIRVKYIGLANLIAGKEICPELIQKQVSPSTIAQKVAGMLMDKKKLADMRNELANVRQRLGTPGASQRVAEIALCLIKKAKGC